MIFASLNRSDAEKVFICCRNVTGATISAGIPVEWDVETASDGNAITGCKSGSVAGLFAGVSDASMADSAYGLIQVYGYRESAYVCRASIGDTPGAFLKPVGKYFDSGQTMSAMTTSGHQYVSLMDTIAASAAYSSAAQIYEEEIFIRAM
jgi:hypothetical protein